jgi:hypothetical protein
MKSGMPKTSDWFRTSSRPHGVVDALGISKKSFRPCTVDIEYILRLGA